VGDCYWWEEYYCQNIVVNAIGGGDRAYRATGLCKSNESKFSCILTNFGDVQ